MTSKQIARPPASKALLCALFDAVERVRVALLSRDPKAAQELELFVVLEKFKAEHGASDQPESQELIRQIDDVYSAIRMFQCS